MSGWTTLRIVPAPRHHAVVAQLGERRLAKSEVRRFKPGLPHPDPAMPGGHQGHHAEVAQFGSSARFVIVRSGVRGPPSALGHSSAGRAAGSGPAGRRFDPVCPINGPPQPRMWRFGGAHGWRATPPRKRLGGRKPRVGSIPTTSSVRARPGFTSGLASAWPPPCSPGCRPQWPHRLVRSRTPLSHRGNARFKSGWGHLHIPTTSHWSVVRMCALFGRVAQLVERTPHKGEVPGSMPGMTTGALE